MVEAWEGWGAMAELGMGCGAVIGNMVAKAGDTCACVLLGVAGGPLCCPAGDRECVCVCVLTYLGVYVFICV